MTTRLVLHPARPASPALRYALLPELRDMVPGDAVPHYRQALAALKQDGPPQEEWSVVLQQCLAVPLPDLPRTESASLLARCETALRELDAAARSERCDWGMVEELRNNGFARVFDMQPLRTLATLAALRVRLDVAEGPTDRAARSLQTGLALARHVADGPMFIPTLVAAAIASILLARLEEWMQQPGAPSFYWPLTDLPRPFLDLRKAMQGERVYVYGNFPGAAEAAADMDAGPWPPELAEKMTTRLREALRGASVAFPNEGDLAEALPKLRKERGDDPNGAPNERDAAEAFRWAVARMKSASQQAPDDPDEAEWLARMTARHEAAKRELIAEGRPKELVDSMPVVQVALLAALRRYDQLFDEYLKVHSLPYWEAAPAVEKADARRAALAKDPNGPALPIASFFAPGVRGVLAAQARLDRRIAALRCVEALRLHAADHDGRLPASLDQIDGAPVPADPVTGRPFDYHPAGDEAVLSAPLIPGEAPLPANVLAYEVTIRR